MVAAENIVYRRRAKTFYRLSNELGKLPSCIYIFIFIAAPVVLLESQHWWVMRKFTHLLMSQSWTWQVVMQPRQYDGDLNVYYCTLRTWGFQILAVILYIISTVYTTEQIISLSIKTSSSLMSLLTHRNRLKPSRGMDNPGCCRSFCQTKIEAGIGAKNNLVFVFDDWPFQRRSILAASQQPSLFLIHRVNSPVSTEIVCACFFSHSLKTSSYGPFGDCERPLFFASG